MRMYLKTREKGKFKFILKTVEKNVITRDINLDRMNFRKLVKKLESEQYIKPDTSSFKLTKTGEELYFSIKKEKYYC